MKGFLHEGRELSDLLFDKIRYDSEACDSLQGFQIIHSLGGGTGSGFGCLLQEGLKDEFPSKIVRTFSVFPS